MPEKLKRDDGVTDLILWHRPMLSIGGLWPNDERGIKFYTLFLYFAIHLSLVICDFFRIVGDSELMVDSLGEIALLSIIMAKMMVVRYSSALPSLMKEVQAESEDNYRNADEKRIYMLSIDIGFRYSRLTVWITTIATTAFYFKALHSFVRAEIFGKTSVFPMPYHIHLFFNVTDIPTYFLLYAYQGPMIYVFSCYGFIACFSLSIVFHVCAQLSVLAYRIRTAKAAMPSTGDRLEPVFCEIVQKHNKIIRTSHAINGIFSLVLLDELIVCTLIQGFCMYNILLNSSLADVIVLFSFFLYISTMLLVMYGYCLAGDFLMQESMNFLNSCYECEWYDMPPRCKKCLLICMIRAKNPLYLTGGGFYTYSLETFTGVIRTAVTYVSMLRQII